MKVEIVKGEGTAAVSLTCSRLEAAPTKTITVTRRSGIPAATAYAS